ncbi:hypothetical protein BH11MYX1_BH11MYX1_51350 [soil metagenome]
MRSLILVGLIAACSPSSRSGGEPQPDAPVHVSVDAAPPAVCFEPQIAGKATIGNADVQGCAIWNNVSRMTGDVTLTRDATSFKMAFANGLKFAGSVSSSNHVTLVNIEPHSYSDGCGWQSTETLTGTLDPSTCVLSLSYDYAEMVVQSDGFCDSPCFGTANVSLKVTPIIQ